MNKLMTMHHEIEMQKGTFEKIRGTLKGDRTEQKKRDLTEKVLERQRPNFDKDSDFARQLIENSMANQRRRTRKGYQWRSLTQNDQHGTRNLVSSFSGRRNQTPKLDEFGDTYDDEIVNIE